MGRLIDYGLVGQYEAESDSYNYRDYLVGTIRYIAPESLYDQRYAPAGDIFSLGFVMLEFLNAITGRRPWERNNEDRVDDARSLSTRRLKASVTMCQRFCTKHAWR